MMTNPWSAQVGRSLILVIAAATLIGIGLTVFPGQSLLPPSLAADAPKTIASAACTKLPDIDGVLGEGEWKEATTIKFDMPMIRINPLAVKKSRAGELRVMNTANTLYIALRAPDATAHRSLDPLEIDLASLAFCKGKDVARGDDRKVLGLDFYTDKHVLDPGKDEDDTELDGWGAAGYGQGFYTFEWSVPLDVNDSNDLIARPGDQFRFNIAFIDRFRPDLKDTLAGGLYGPDLDHAALWGTLRLAKVNEGAPSRPDESAGPSTRPFHMGFNRWPADLTPEGFLTAQDFAHEHGDIVSVVFNGGIPWPEALDDKPFSQDVRNNLNYRPPQGKRLFLYISPLNSDRKGLASYWSEKDNQPLPSPWNTYAINSPQVKKAYLNFVLRAVEEMNPDYLAIGIELNILLSHSATKWKELKELHTETYAAVKKKHPRLPVFFSTEIQHYKKLMAEAKNSDQENEVAELMKYSDLFCWSLYPHMSFEIPRPVPAGFFDFARKFNKPIAVGEIGDSSRDVELKAYNVTLRGNEASQKQLTEILLETAAKDRYEFVIWNFSTDFEKLCDQLPKEVGDFARIWAYTGLQTSAKSPKPALAVWDAYLKAKYLR